MSAAENREMSRSDLQQTFEVNGNVSYNSAESVLQQAFEMNGNVSYNSAENVLQQAFEMNGNVSYNSAENGLQQAFEMNGNVSYNSAENVLTSVSVNADETERIYEEIPNVSVQDNGSSKNPNRIRLLSFIAAMVTIIFVITAVFIVVVVIVLVNMNTVIVNKSPENNTDIKIITTTAPVNFITSCSMLPKSSPSDYYWVLSSKGSTIRVYCDMKKTCGSITGGWMRVTSLDMKQNSSKCPSRLCLDNSEPRTCRRCYHDGRIPKEKYDVGVTYSHVCGRVIAYQVGKPDGYSLQFKKKFDGVSPFYGSLEFSIWSFVAVSEANYTDSNVCPCINPNDISIVRPSPYVGKNYFCDTATSKAQPGVFYTKNPLWDGQGCKGSNICCSFNSPPWFYRKLPEPTTEAIVMKIKLNKDPSNEDIAIEVVDIYVH